MIQFTALIRKFGQKGEKTGWTYIEVPKDVTEKLKPGNKKSFRVKGKLDNYPINKTALLPVGDGTFIMPLNAELRKGTGKKEGLTLSVQLEADNEPIKLNAELLDCLACEPDALDFFNSLPKSHRHYFSKWVESAKTDTTKARRIAQAIVAMINKQGFSEMMRAIKGQATI